MRYVSATQYCRKKSSEVCSNSYDFDMELFNHKMQVPEYKAHLYIYYLCDKKHLTEDQSARHNNRIHNPEHEFVCEKCEYPFNTVFSVS